MAGSCGVVNIYENNNKLSLGYCYDNYMLRRDFEELSMVDRRNYLLTGCVLENADEFIKLNDNKTNLYDKISEAYGEDKVAYHMDEDGKIIL